MATAVSTIVNRVRNQVGDWPSLATLTSSPTSSSTSFTVSDGTLFTANQLLEVETEVMRVTSVSSNTLTVQRAMAGTSAAAHTTGTSVLVKPRFLIPQILDAIADGIDAAFPYIYKRVTDTSLTAAASTYEYTIPAMPSDSAQIIPYIWRVETKESGDLDYYPLRRWEIIRGATPKLHLLREQSAGALIRLHGYGPFPRLTSSSSTLDDQWPRNLEFPLTQYAAAILLLSGENYRVAVDTGVLDDREQANRPGASTNAAQAAFQMWQYRVSNSGYPPMARHVKKVV